MGRDRRRYPRASVGLAVTCEAAGGVWQGRTVDLSPFGAKVSVLGGPIDLPPGTSVQLRFPPQDQGLPLLLPASVVRTNAAGIALDFGSLGDQQFQCLKEYVCSLVLREWHEMLTPPANGGGLQASADLSGEPFTSTDRRSHTSGGNGSREDRWQALLDRLGLDLQIPSNGLLSRQWREFLERLETQAASAGG